MLLGQKTKGTMAFNKKKKSSQPKTNQGSGKKRGRNRRISSAFTIVYHSRRISTYRTAPFTPQDQCPPC